MARFQAHSATSRAAARHTERHRERHDRKRILEFYRNLKKDEDATGDEVQQRLKLLHQTGSARIADLLQDGKLIESGRRRRTRQGCWADALRLAPPGTPSRSARARHKLEGFTHSQLARLRFEIEKLDQVVELGLEMRRLLTWLRKKAPGVQRPGT